MHHQVFRRCVPRINVRCDPADDRGPVPLIASVNLANLPLARATARQRIHRSPGARRIAQPG